MYASPVMACVAFGANLGDAVASVQQALRDVADLTKTQLVKASSLYRSAPYEAHGPDFINAVALVQTQLLPLELLQALQAFDRITQKLSHAFDIAPARLGQTLAYASRCEYILLATDQCVLSKDLRFV